MPPASDVEDAEHQPSDAAGFSEPELGPTHRPLRLFHLSRRHVLLLLSALLLCVVTFTYHTEHLLSVRIIKEGK